MTNPSSTLAQTSTRAWSLSKTGVIDESSSTVTWSINATQSATIARRLVVTGHVIVRNTGGASAPIGNVVVRLQSKSGSTWTTRSADVADATNGDAAISVRAVTASGATTISECSGSGPLSVAISPTIVVGGNSIITLPFTASFNNDVLGIAAGAAVRAEILVTFGNASGGNNPPNVDINGNGMIDSTEDRVGSVATLLGDKVIPAPAPVTTPVTLSDTNADIATAGTASFTNPVFSLGATTGTVQVTYDGGEDGGEIMNCAHLTGTGINLTACDTQRIAAEPFQWITGDVVTLRQVDHDVSPLLANAQPFGTAFPTGITVGTFAGPNDYSILLTNGPAVQGYLATAGTNTALTANHINPTIGYGGQLGGELVAVTLNIGFSAGGQIGGSYKVGDLYLCGLATPVDDTTVASFLAMGNVLLGGGAVAGMTLDQANTVAAEINAAFLGGVPSTWASTHLSPTPCP